MYPFSFIFWWYWGIMKEIKKQAKTQKRIDKKIAHKKDSFRLRKADRINASAFEGLSLDQV